MLYVRCKRNLLVLPTTEELEGETMEKLDDQLTTYPGYYQAGDCYDEPVGPKTKSRRAQSTSPIRAGTTKRHKPTPAEDDATLVMLRAAGISEEEIEVSRRMDSTRLRAQEVAERFQAFALPPAAFGDQAVSIRSNWTLTHPPSLSPQMFLSDSDNDSDHDLVDLTTSPSRRAFSPVRRAISPVRPASSPVRCAVPAVSTLPVARAAPPRRSAYLRRAQQPWVDRFPAFGKKLHDVVQDMRQAAGTTEVVIEGGQ